MTKETFMKGMAIFLSTFLNIDPDKKSQEAWYILLKDLEDEQFDYAIKRICNYDKDFKYTANFVALIREYSSHYVPPERPQLQSHEMSSEYWRLRIENWKKKLKAEKGIDYDSLGETARDKCMAYCRMILADKPDNIMSGIIK